MFTLKQTILLAMVGAAYALPAAHRHRGDFEGEGPFGRGPGSFGYDSSPSVSEGKTPTTNQGTTVITVFPQSGKGGSDSNKPKSGSGSGSGSAPAPATGSDSGSSGSDTGYMAIVNKYRQAGGLSPLTQSSKLEANALKTASDGNGQMVHQLNPGTMGQVLAPGGANDFEKVYVGGWLCEIPSLPGLNGVCGSMTAGWDHSSGQTGHAKILTSTSYSSIGCKLAEGIWACDLG